MDPASQIHHVNWGCMLYQSSTYLASPMSPRVGVGRFSSQASVDRWLPGWEGSWSRSHVKSGRGDRWWGNCTGRKRKFYLFLFFTIHSEVQNQKGVTSSAFDVAGGFIISSTFTDLFPYRQGPLQTPTLACPCLSQQKWAQGFTPTTSSQPLPWEEAKLLPRAVSLDVFIL